MPGVLILFVLVRYDMFVGGVSHYGEDSLATARREVQEELGVGGENAEFRFLFNCLIETDMNRSVSYGAAAAAAATTMDFSSKV